MSYILDDILIKPKSTKTAPVILAVGVEIDSNGVFPSVENATLGKLRCISVYVTGHNGVMVYGAYEQPPELKKHMNQEQDIYVKCRDDDDMLIRALRFIKMCNPTCICEECIQDYDFLVARAAGKKLKTDVPNLDKMFDTIRQAVLEPERCRILSKTQYNQGSI